MDVSTPFKRAIEAAGGVTKLAVAMGITAQRVSNWVERGVPAERCPDIERATGGAVTCEELRPDVDWAYLRGTDPLVLGKPAKPMASAAGSGEAG